MFRDRQQFDVAEREVRAGGMARNKREKCVGAGPWRALGTSRKS